MAFAVDFDNLVAVSELMLICVIRLIPFVYTRIGTNSSALVVCISPVYESSKAHLS